MIEMNDPGFDLSHFSPGIVPNDSDIIDPEANEQKLRHAGHISYPAFTVSASENKLHEPKVNFNSSRVLLGLSLG